MNAKFVKIACAAAMAMFCALPSPAYDSLSEWVNDVHNGSRWQTGQLATLAAAYKKRIEANGADHEARILHAATILAQLGENKNVAAYAKKFGYTFDFLRMKESGKCSAPSSWPAANAMVDTFVKEGVPVLKDALADLAGIPDDWTGSVLLSSDEYPLDEDVYVDIGDVLYARAGIEAAIGMAYFAHGYDLTVDYAKAKAAWDYEITVPLVKSAPSVNSEEGWDAGVVSAGGGVKALMSGTKLYLRFDNARCGADWWWVYLENVKTGKGVEVSCWKDGERLVASAYDYDLWDGVGLGAEEIFNEDESYVLVVDLSAKRELLANGTWTMDDGSAWILVDEDTYDVRSIKLDGGAAFFGKLLAEQTKFMAKVRNQSSLETSKTWMTAALNCALSADVAVRSRTDDAMHFIEYDPIDEADIGKARNLTQKALDSLAAPQEVDVQGEVLSGRETKFDVSLLPNDGLMRVYLGALFEGKITRDLLPAFQKGANEGPVPVIETIKDPTLAGLLPDFAAKTWSHLVQDMGYAVAHQTVSLKLDVNGGKLPKGAPTAISLDFDEESEECYYPELPVPGRAGFIFTGWATAKSGGALVRLNDVYDASLFAGAKVPTLYAQWLKLYTFTLKGGNVSASWEWSEEQTETLPQEAFEGEYATEVNDRGTMDVPEGAVVHVWAEEQSKDNKGNPLAFQKWTVSSAKASLGPDFHVTWYDTQLVMPAEKLTLTATYIDGSMCGSLIANAAASNVQFGWNEEAGAPYTIEPPYEAFEWSPDGGKTWYKARTWYTEGEAALLKAGAYTVTWRSADPNWQAPSSKTKTTVSVGEEKDLEGDFTFTYVPQVVIDVMAFENGELRESAAAGTVTMNPKDGLVPVGKPTTLTAKAAKDYAFQGWTLANDWTYDDGFLEASATWKFENCETSVSQSYFSLNEFIDPADQKVHVKAIFKPFTAYSADDIVFNGIGSYGFGGYYGNYSAASDDGSGNVAVSIRAVVGCALDNLKIDCGLAATPLAYKLDGKLPAGLKFDAKTGVFSGVPTKDGDATVTVIATDPAKNARRLLVNINVRALPKWLVGDFRAMSREYSCEGEWVYNTVEGYDEWVSYELVGGQNGLLELSVTAAGKVSAKYLHRGGTYSLSGSLSWSPDEDDPSEEGAFYFSKDDSKGSFEVAFSDGGIEGYVSTFFKNGRDEETVDGKLEGLRHDASLLKDSNFTDKYYTFAFHAEDDSSGHGYLTIKTDKKGGAKVTGQLPDGEKVSMSALIMPHTDVHVCCGMAVDPDDVSARLFLFASPASYKKVGWFAMALALASNGLVSVEDGAVWTPASIPEGPYCVISGSGAEYSAAEALDKYYWSLSCDHSEEVKLEYSYKYMEANPDNPGKPLSRTEYRNAIAQDLDGYFFNVEVKGDNKGAISLAKNPSLSFAFTKATGIFTGKATVYFDYDLPSYKLNSKTKEIEESYAPQHKTASLPYAGVMVAGDGGLEGFGAALYTFKYTDVDPDSGKAKQATKAVSLPVSLKPGNAEP